VLWFDEMANTLSTIMTRGQFPPSRAIHRKTLTRGRVPAGDDLHCILVAENEDVLVSVQNGVGLIVLNRPKAINSLTHPMVNVISKVLADWLHDDGVRAVVLSGAGERGLCAGGDIVEVYNSARAGGHDAASFWYDEYRLNAQIARFPKPYVALMDGIVMGGGVGVSAHARVRVVTETTKMAMPEVGIGFIPDVGGTYLLSRAPWRLGQHAAITGAPFDGADAIALGFADHYVPHEKLAAFRQSIVDDGVDAALAAHAIEPPVSNLLAQRSWIDECYAGDTVEDIIAALRGQDEVLAHEAADLIATRSPISVCVALEAVRRAASLEKLEDVLRQEYRTSCGSLRSHDLVEGIRAQVIDKDRNPKWSPATLSAVTQLDIEEYFKPADRELEFS
jgi:enoyl-CoA hydratase